MDELPNTIESLRKFLKQHPEHAPTVPDGPGLGLGGRMGRLASTSAMLAIEKLGIRASAVQCSVFRELVPEALKDKNILVEYKGIGQVPIGHTGMTIQGQFLTAVRDRILRGITVPYVADADHIPLRGDRKEDLAEFETLVREARDRTLFTIDPHFCIPEKAGSLSERFLPALSGIRKANDVIARIKNGDPYRVEVSIDECPGVTTEEEFIYIVKALMPLKLPLFSIAPAIGFDKKDNDIPLAQSASFSKMLKIFHAIVADYGLLLGIHSGDGKGPRTLHLIAEATQGRVWYKVSPDRQRLFFKTLSELPQGSDGYQLFIEMLEYLQKALRDNSWTFSDDVKNNVLKYLDPSEETARWKALSDVGFLLVRPFKNRLSRLGAEFETRYFDMDNRYISELADNLGLTSSMGKGKEINIE